MYSDSVNPLDQINRMKVGSSILRSTFLMCSAPAHRILLEVGNECMLPSAILFPSCPLSVLLGAAFRRLHFHAYRNTA
jgi:hypothetical protein